MALKLFPIPFPIFAPPPNSHPSPAPNANPDSNSSLSNRPASEVRFARWNNANAEKFNERRRSLKEIEDDIRRQRRFTGVDRIANTYNPAPPKPITTGNTTDYYKSIGTPSSPSSPSIPGKKSKYSKDPTNHPAFRYLQKPRNISPSRSRNNNNGFATTAPQPAIDRKAEVKLSEDGLTYTETPKVKPLKLREPAYAPFGPTTMYRPWTGRAPLSPSKKKLKEFDSFTLPPPHKKGVKPVQSPGPYLDGSGPKYVWTRDQILGEPLTQEEINALVHGCQKAKRQLNMGRDGFTHNMLDNIHSHWKRRRVCKIKCLGVCTVDMDNVCQQLEEKTGGKVIYRKGGVLYLFRGRNYNWRTRPRFPLMLWRPITPVYPRLVKLVPEGLTLEEATELRKKGHALKPICKLGKNGVYIKLVKNVREAFEECELVRINCEGMNGSDYRRIGAKLKDLVPCVIMSFKYEHLLIWRGRNWKSSHPEPEDDNKEAEESNTESVISITASAEGQDSSASSSQVLSFQDMSTNLLDTSTSPVGSDKWRKDLCASKENMSETAFSAISTVQEERKESTSDIADCSDDKLEAMTSNTESTSISAFMVGDNELSKDSHDSCEHGTTWSDIQSTTGESTGSPLVSDTKPAGVRSRENELESSVAGSLNHERSQDVSGNPEKSSVAYTEGVLRLWRQAIENGSAVVLDDASLDADIVYWKAMRFAQSAPPGPIFEHHPRWVASQKGDEKESSSDSKVKEVPTVAKKNKSKKDLKLNIERKIVRTDDLDGQYLDIVPKGCLGVDELAKLLA
ncbi:hypothetical protein HS088_TW09G01054 [Tripterygium wilfordii]|uniref:CRM domain-containing protein n=1 Tax=Tripterygium wilfordii TaxID=458696 RepID=A0A7J7D9H3_TRIWF|nr:hypothetical protein HS088_TW09G01054 [Tripterygium wilfordii]